MATTVTKSIGTSSRDYSTMQAWEDACPASLVTADQVWRGEMYNDAEFTGQLYISGITTDATRYLELTTATGQSFRDHASVRTTPFTYNQSHGVGISSNALFANLIDSRVNFTRISKLQIYNTSTGGKALTDGSLAAINQQWQDVLLICMRSDCAVGLTAGSTLRNAVVVQLDPSGVGVQTYNNPSNTTMHGCVLLKPSDVTAGGTGATRFYGAPLMTSCAVLGFPTPVQSPASWSASSGFNATDAASGLPGSSNQHSISYTQTTPFTDADKDSLDLRAIAGTSLINTGQRDATNAPNDISGTARTATPTIGHWEVVAAAGGGVVLMAGDLTTAWHYHLATLAPPTNETERALLATAYGMTPGVDATTAVSRFLQTRQAPAPARVHVRVPPVAAPPAPPVEPPVQIAPDYPAPPHMDMPRSRWDRVKDTVRGWRDGLAGGYPEWLDGTAVHWLYYGAAA